MSRKPLDEEVDFLTHTVSFHDSWQFTVMSYFDQTENIFHPADFACPVTPMIADIMTWTLLLLTTQVSIQRYKIPLPRNQSLTPSP